MLKHIILSVSLIASQVPLARPSPPPHQQDASLGPKILTLGEIEKLKQPPRGPLILYLSESEWAEARKKMRPSTTSPPDGTVVIHAIADSRGGVVLVPSCKAPTAKTCRVMTQIEKGGLSFYPSLHPAPVLPRDAVGRPAEPPNAQVNSCRHVLGRDPSTGLPLPYCSGSCPATPGPGAPIQLESCRVFLGSNGDYSYYYCACTIAK